MYKNSSTFILLNCWFARSFIYDYRIMLFFLSNLKILSCGWCIQSDNQCKYFYTLFYKILLLKVTSRMFVD